MKVYAPSATRVRNATSAASRFPSFLFLDTTCGNCRDPTMAAMLYLKTRALISVVLICFHKGGGPEHTVMSRVYKRRTLFLFSHLVLDSPVQDAPQLVFGCQQDPKGSCTWCWQPVETCTDTKGLPPRLHLSVHTDTRAFAGQAALKHRLVVRTQCTHLRE